MYTNRKLLANQSAAEREKFYCEKAYEYTLRADSAEKILRRYEAMLDEFRKIRTAHEYSPEKSKLAVDIFNALIYAIKTTAEESGCVRMVLYFAEWKIYMLKEPIFYGKEMNLLLTAFEKLLCEIDPNTWLRELPTRKKCNQPMARPEIWNTLSYDSMLSKEDTNKQNLKDCYLADALRSMGIDVRGGFRSACCG